MSTISHAWYGFLKDHLAKRSPNRDIKIKNKITIIIICPIPWITITKAPYIGFCAEAVYVIKSLNTPYTNKSINISTSTKFLIFYKSIGNAISYFVIILF